MPEELGLDSAESQTVVRPSLGDAGAWGSPASYLPSESARVFSPFLVLVGGGGVAHLTRKSNFWQAIGKEQILGGLEVWWLPLSLQEGVEALKLPIQTTNLDCYWVCIF